VKENGTYQIEVGASCEDIRLTQEYVVSGYADINAPYADDTNAIYSALQLNKITDSVFESMSGQKIPKIPPTLPLHFESRFSDFQQTFMGRILFKAVTGVALKQRKKALKMPQGAARDNAYKGSVFLYRILESNCMRSFCMSAGQSMPINIAEGFVLLGNGKILKGIGRILKKVKMPPLPKNKEGDN
jgi:hypothetical protein